VSPDDPFNTILFMLALMTWREARSEGFTAMLAVAYIPNTRAEKGGWFGGSLLACIEKPYQFSSMTTPRDPQLTTWPTLTDPSWDDALLAAKSAIAKSQVNPAPEADSYYSTDIAPPSWATPENFVVQIGKLRFFKTV
jgi:spore germination cell wall hydrolase CwlJ-like protein